MTNFVILPMDHPDAQYPTDCRFCDENEAKIAIVWKGGWVGVLGGWVGVCRSCRQDLRDALAEDA